MSRYSKTDEQNVRMNDAVVEWARSGLLDGKQGAVLAKEVEPSLKRTNNFLRAVLFLFTCLITGAAVLLALTEVSNHDKTAISTICLLGAILCFGLAEVAIGQFRIYRFGIEEAFVVMAVVFVAAATFEIVDGSRYESTLSTLLAVVSCASVLVYWRFGFLYAGIAAIASAALLPFPFVESLVMERLLSAAVLLVVFLIARRLHLAYGDDFPGDDCTAFQCAAWAGLYICANLKIPPSEITGGWFYWTTYALIWILPFAGLCLGIRGKDRFLIDINVAAFLATLYTNKIYLGLERQTWDPMLLGLLLAGIAAVLRRWLVSGPKGERYGFTPARLLSVDAQVMSALSTASATFQPQLAPHQPAASHPKFDGGRSGGAGATGEF
jgi:hypothetical protein